MQNYQLFHQVVGEFLKNMGFEVPTLEAEQDVITLEIDEKFPIHCGLIDNSFWFMLAEVMPADVVKDLSYYPEWLKNNQIGAGEWQPVVALDERDQLTCWLRLPLLGCDWPMQTKAFDAIITTAQRLLATEGI